MKLWIKISLLLCTYGFFREIRPSEPFVTEYLSGDWRPNITSEDLTLYVYPVGTYSSLSQLCVVFLITDFLRYKPLIIVSSMAGVIVWSMLLWTTSLEALQVLQFFYGTFMSMEIAYYTYIYAKVDKKHFQTVTGHTRGAMLVGRFTGGVLGQLLVSFKLMDFRELNYISLTTQGIALVWAFMLPPVDQSVYFHRKSSSLPEDGMGESKSDISESEKPTKAKFKEAAALLMTHFRGAYTNPKVLLWSFWWSLAMGGFMQVQTYVQLLWQVIEPNQDVIYNGGIEAMLTIFGALGAFLAGTLKDERIERFGIWALTACSAVEGGVIIWAALTGNIFISYFGYVLFGVLYQFMVTVSSAEVAKTLAADSYGMVFGFNTILALIFQSIITLIVITGLDLKPRDQFVVYGGYFVVLSVVYGFFGLVNSFTKNKRTLSSH